MKTIIERMYSITQKMRNPKDKRGGIIINKETVKAADAELRELRKTLGMNTMQVLILTAVISNSSRYTVSGDDVALSLGMEYLQFLSHDKDMEFLKKNGYVRIDNDGNIKVPTETLKSLKGNNPVVPDPTTGLTTDRILCRLKKLLGIRKSEEMTDEELCEEVDILMRANPETSISRAYRKHLQYINDDEKIMFCVLLHRYWFEHDDQVSLYDVEDYMDEECMDILKMGYLTERLALQAKGIIEYSGDGGIVSKEYFRLKDAIKDELFEDMGGARKKEARISASRKLDSATILRKELFYNSAEGEQISQLTELLSATRFDGIRSRIKDKGLRSGFTCLFYGSPGTGKTETVYQIARESGRDLFIVDVSQIKSCWVGESEKNIKDVFDKYRACVRANTGPVPILLFNEADAIFGIRQQGAERAVDKMENSIQNIILQEMEDLDGILIATTNLTENLDKAFERRFLYKVRFEKPSREVKCRIWKSMIPDLTDENAKYLADSFELSGGQIENVSRKKTIQGILSGKEPAIEDIVKYCCEEDLGANKDRRRIGF